MELPDQGPRGTHPSEEGVPLAGIPGAKPGLGILSSELKGPQGSPHPPHIRSWNHHP